MHFTHHTKVNDVMKFYYYKKNLKSLLLKQLGFAIECPLQLNGWNDMGLVAH
jgi:abortive infection bacteriophage resistance protein